MATYHSWQNVLDDITTYSRKSKFFLKFVKLKTNDERLTFCLKDDFVKVRIHKWFTTKTAKKYGKSVDQAYILRTEGNHHFHEREYDKALELYTQSILFAPTPHKSSTGASPTEELAIGYANRSAALFHLSKFQECLADIERAENYGYPRELCYKLNLRKGQCLLKLNQKNLADQTFDRAIELLKEAKLDEKKIAKQEREIGKLKLADAIEMGTTENGQLAPLPPLYKGPHPKIAFTSAALKLQWTAEKGRYLVASSPITAGDVLLVEPAFASVLLPSYYSSRCHHCYLQCLAPVPCRQCCQVLYCSSACSQESWSRYHWLECGKLDLLHSVGIAHLSLRVLLAAGAQTILEDLEKPVTELEGCQNDGCYGNSYFSVFHLMSHVDDMHAEDLLQYTLTACLLYLLLDDSGYLRDWPETRRDTAGGLLLHHILQLVCNAHAITAMESAAPAPSTAVSEQRQARVATAIYPSASLMNHSCDPSVISSFHKSILIVRAIKDIPEGGEVYNCYGPHFSRMSREDRQRSLKEQYFFSCKCDTCTSEDDREQRFQALKCPSCEGPLRLPSPPSNWSQCIECEQQSSLLQLQQKVFTAHDLYVQGVQLAAKGSYTDALEKLKKCLRLRTKVMYKRNKHLAEAQDQIAMCYAALGEFQAAAGYLKPSLPLTEEMYGPTSIELAHELHKYSDLLIQCLHMGEPVEPKEEILSVVNRATQIFTLHYGEHHEAVKELAERRRQLEDPS